METVLYKNGKIGKIDFISEPEVREDGFYTIINGESYKYIHGMWMAV